MRLSRRDLAALLPALAVAQDKQDKTMPSKVYHSDKIAYDGDERKKAREFFHGPTHTGFSLEAHETILGPGVQTHAPHKHEHEEIMIVYEGTVETLLEGKSEIAERGSVIYFGSNQMHSVRNAGTTPCGYYVIELRGKEA